MWAFFGFGLLVAGLFAWYCRLLFVWCLWVSVYLMVDLCRCCGCVVLGIVFDLCLMFGFGGNVCGLHALLFGCLRLLDCY